MCASSGQGTGVVVILGGKATASDDLSFVGPEMSVASIALMGSLLFGCAMPTVGDMSMSRVHCECGVRLFLRKTKVVAATQTLERASHFRWAQLLQSNP